MWPVFEDSSEFEFYWPKLRDSSVDIAAIERIRSVAMLKLSCLDIIISHFKAHHRLNLLLDPNMTKNAKKIRAITLQLQKRQKRSSRNASLPWLRRKSSMNFLIS